MTADEIYPHLVRFLPDPPPPLDEIRYVVELNKVRGRTLKEVATLLEPFLASDESIEYEPDAVKKHVKGDDLADRMTALHNALAEVAPFDITTTEAALRGVAESRGLSAGKLIHPMRLALTGRGASPPIFDVAVALGRDRTLRRLKRLIEKIPTLL